jgi:hypothetical protein
MFNWEFQGRPIELVRIDKNDSLCLRRFRDAKVRYPLPDDGEKGGIDVRFKQLPQAWRCMPFSGSPARLPKQHPQALVDCLILIGADVHSILFAFNLPGITFVYHTLPFSTHSLNCTTLNESRNKLKT